MIARMTKVYVATTVDLRDRLLEALRELGVLHLIPVDADAAVPDEQTQHRLDAFARAEQILATEQPGGPTPDLDPLDAAREALAIQRRAAESSNRLTSLYRQIEQLDIWGDLRLEQLDDLAEKGITVRFYTVPADDADQFQAECVRTLRPLPGKESLVALAWRGEQQPEVPESAEQVERPQKDRPTLQAEAAEIDDALRCDRRRLSQLATLLPEIRHRHARAQAQADFVVAQRGGLSDEALFAVQGWAPEDQAGHLDRLIRDKGIPAAVERMEPSSDEQPPTLIRYPRWARPIKALLDMLGTVPGYREFDLAPFFMLAMPIFTALLVGDAGYGLIFTLIGTLLYGKIARGTSVATAQLILVFAATTLLWGVLSGNAFGVGPDQLSAAGGVGASLGGAWKSIALFWSPDPKAARDIVMMTSFILGCVHLTLAHVRRALALLPGQEGIAELGWIGFVFGMFTLVWFMFFRQNPGPLIPPMATLWILVASWTVIALFSSPDRNPLKRIAFGVLGNLMSIPGAFGDMLSYIRLMAVGLASYYIASAFNDLATQLTDASLWALPATVLILIFAHSLNIALCLVAIFAHGVRLNMLEFSTNAGVQWSGHPYSPFALRTSSNEGDHETWNG